MLSLADFIAVALVTGGHDFTNPNIQTMHSWICPFATIPQKPQGIPYTLQETNIIPLKKEYHRLKNVLGWDMSSNISNTIRTQRMTDGSHISTTGASVGPSAPRTMALST